MFAFDLSWGWKPERVVHLRPRLRLNSGKRPEKVEVLKFTGEKDAFRKIYSRKDISQRELVSFRKS